MKLPTHTFVYPDVEGGQGRSSEEVKLFGRIVGICFLLGALFVLALVVWA